MTIITTAGVPIDEMLLQNYMKTLVNQFFKILPIRETEEHTLATYVRSLQLELLGCKELIAAIHEDPQFLSLIAILQFFIDNPNCDVHEVKREVFKAISICNKLSQRYQTRKDGDDGQCLG